jgi:hypothetical protein
MTSVPPPSTPPGEGPPQGWYQDPQGAGLRWWDGRAWTEHTHGAVAAEPASAEPAEEEADLGLTIGEDDDDEGAGPARPEPTRVETVTPAESATPATSAEPPGAAPPAAAAEGLRRHARLLVLLAILVVTLIVALVVMGGDDEGGGGGGEGAASEADVVFADGRAQEASRTAQTAIETYATDQGGSYEGATPADLVAIEQTLEGVDLAVDAQRDSYAVTVTSEVGDNTFTISRTSDSEITHGCAAPGTGACPQSGVWGQ